MHSLQIVLTMFFILLAIFVVDSWQGMKDLPALVATLKVMITIIQHDLYVLVFMAMADLRATTLFQNFWEPVTTVMLSTKDARIGEFYESYKNSCAPNPVEDLSYQSNRSFFEDFLLRIVGSCAIYRPGRI